MTDTPESSRARIEALHAEISYLIQHEKARIDREQPHLSGMHRTIEHARWEVLGHNPASRQKLRADYAQWRKAVEHEHAD